MSRPSRFTPCPTTCSFLFASILPTPVLLIGGTSHAGKSTVARALSSDLGCDLHSCDGLAKHPGRPWPGPRGTPVPPHVVEHYSSIEADQLLIDVLGHYERNVVPRVRELVEQYQSGPNPRCAVIEGSALWPEFVVDIAGHPAVRAAWLVADDELLQDRIYKESGYVSADEGQRQLIDRFLERTLVYNEKMVMALKRLGLSSVHVASESPEELAHALLHSL